MHHSRGHLNWGRPPAVARYRYSRRAAFKFGLKSLKILAKRFLILSFGQHVGHLVRSPRVQDEDFEQMECFELNLIAGISQQVHGDLQIFFAADVINHSRVSFLRRIEQNLVQQP